MQHWKRTAALSALLVTVSAVPAAANGLVRTISAPVVAKPISMPVEVVPISAPSDGMIPVPGGIGTSMRISGTVEWVDLEGGFYAVDGWRLIGDREQFAKLLGQQVVVIGAEFKGISFQMVPAIEVASIELAAQAVPQGPVDARSPLPATILVDGKPVDFALGAPAVSDGVLLVPLRSIAEALGGKVTWDPATRGIHIDLPGRTATFAIGQPEAEMNEDGVYYIQRNMIKMAAAPVIKGDRTLISADALTNVLGLSQVKAEEGVLSLVSGRAEVLTPPEETAELKLVGKVNQVEEGRILVEGAQMSNVAPMLIWIRLTDETKIAVGEAAGSVADLTVGAEVIVELSGPILESYPAQGGAASIQVIPAAQADVISGTIEAVDENGRILVVGPAMPTGEPIKVWFALNEETKITVGGAEGTKADLTVGAKVDVVASGPMLMSYPAQGGAVSVNVTAAPKPGAGSIQGKIKTVEEGRILVEGGTDILWLFTGNARIVKAIDGVEQPATAADLAVGQEVEAEYSGPMLKSYPGQVGADVIRILK